MSNVAQHSPPTTTIPATSFSLLGEYYFNMISRIYRFRATVPRARMMHTTPRVLSQDPKHSAESYFKDVDDQPPADNTIHRVDSGSDAVQRPLDPPANAFSKASTIQEGTHQSTDNTYKYKGEEGKTKYGAKGGDHEASPPETGPAGQSAEGRHPEGR